MVRKNASKILLVISGILFVISLYLFIVSYQNKNGNIPKVIECEKETFSNGMMTLNNKYKLKIKEDGQLLSIVNEEEFYFPVECKYEDMKSDNFLEGYTCKDTYDEDKKVTCSKDELNNGKVWYVSYMDSLIADGYVCK